MTEKEVNIPSSIRKIVPTKVPKLLEAAAETFHERSEVYGNAYLRGGATLLAIFPEEGVPAITNERDAARLRFITLCAMKLQRYCQNFSRGGHADSARDLVVYAAMLEEATDQR